MRTHMVYYQCRKGDGDRAQTAERKITMKYNRSEIMKAAWNGYRAMKHVHGYTFGMALKHAWMMARKNAEKAAAEASKQTFDGYAVVNGYSFRLWEKEVAPRKTIRRIYINSGNSNKGGFIDLDTMAIRANGTAASVARTFLDQYNVA